MTLKKPGYQPGFFAVGFGCLENYHVKQSKTVVAVSGQL